ncbi:hypothetical protein OpiT1DRAFT_02988 [Opitutaceae bacterium TAV1]|nr:hypothetical protein OpiT1DRAFT_02988 [Opitutaceae bacterium TAV1]
MKSRHPLVPVARAALVLGSLALLPSLRAQVLTGFEVSNGYTDATSVVGVNDSGIPGSAAWESQGNAASTSSANPLSGDLALRILRTAETAGSSGAKIDLSGAGVDFTSGTVTLGFSMAISNYSAGTGNQVQILFGNNTINPGGSKYWTSLIFSDGVLYLYRDNSGLSNNTGVNLGAYTTYSALGGYIDFSISFDPVAKTYTNVTLTGTETSADLTSSFAGTALPWLSGTAGDPGQWLTLVVGGNDIVTVDFDNLSLSSIPEPSAFALCAGLAGLVAVLSIRRRRTVAETA